jgi:hypothetical protein
MNSSSGTIHDPAVLRAEQRAEDSRVIAFFIVLALAIVAGLLIWQAFNGVEAGAPLAGRQFLAANPEFLAVESYAAWHPATSTQALRAEETVLARNPELKVLAQFATVQDDHAFLAQNPELSAVRRYEQLKAGE